MATKKVIAGVALVGGLAVSIYLWSTVGMGEDQGDQKIAQQMMDFTCPACKQNFQLSVADAGEIRRANNGEIVCKLCGATGSQKQGATIALSGDGGGFKDEPEETPEEQPASNEPVKPKPGGGGRKKLP